MNAQSPGCSMKRYLTTYSNGRLPSVHTSYAAARRETGGYGTPDGEGDVWVYASRADLAAAADGSPREVAVVRSVPDVERALRFDDLPPSWRFALERALGRSVEVAP